MTAPAQTASERDTMQRGRWGEALEHPRAVPYLLVGSTLLLLSLGLLMVWSSSAIFSIRLEGSSVALVSKQAMYAVIGLVAMVALSRMSPQTIRGLAWPAYLLVLGLLVLVLIPGIGVEVAGQQNWISLGGPFRLQPSELAKLALVIWGADTLARRWRPVMSWHQLLVPLLPGAALLAVLVVLENDFGNAMIIAVIMGAMLFVAGTPMRFFGVLGVAGLSAVVLLALAAPYRVQRFTAFLDPEADRLDGAWQVTQGTYALGTGGFFGVGLGASREKWGSLPAAHTDFIFPVVGEELGLVGTMAVLALFATLIFAITRLIRMTSDRFTQFVAAGVAGWIAIQVITNVGAALKLMPITGVTLPLLSYGGSSMISTLAAVGIVIALAKSAAAEQRRRVRPGQRSRPGRP